MSVYSICPLCGGGMVTDMGDGNHICEDCGYEFTSDAELEEMGGEEV